MSAFWQGSQGHCPAAAASPAGDVLPGVLAAARRAALLVIGARLAKPLRDSILGTHAERLLRLCRVPVLVVKRPATAGYRRVLVPVDLTPDAGPVIAAASAFSRDPTMEVFHALGTRDELAMRWPRCRSTWCARCGSAPRAVRAPSCRN